MRIHRVISPTKAPKPGSPEWTRHITASKVPVILGLSPFKSAFTLWHEMNGTATQAEGHGDTFAWGHLAEDALIRYWEYKQDKPWIISKQRGGSREVTYTNTRLAYPNLVTLDARVYPADTPRHYRILECKTTRSLRAWDYPDQPDSVPDYYRAQVLFQMMVSGIHEANVIVHCNGTPEIHTVHWDPVKAKEIDTACKAWWKSLLLGTPPQVDGSEAEMKLIRGLHPEIEDTTATVTDEQAQEVHALAEKARAAQKEFEQCKADLALHMGSARHARTSDGGLVATRVPSRYGPVLRLSGLSRRGDV